jgi:hypothetical protein
MQFKADLKHVVVSLRATNTEPAVGRFLPLMTRLQYKVVKRQKIEMSFTLNSSILEPVSGPGSQMMQLTDFCKSASKNLFSKKNDTSNEYNN